MTPGDVASIHIAGNEKMATVNNIPSPTDLMMAQYSMPFSVALAHYRNPRDPASFNRRASTIRHPLAGAAVTHHGGGRGQARPHHRLDRHGDAQGRPRARRKRRELQGHAGAAARPRRDAREVPAADAALRRHGDGAAVRAAAEHRKRTQPRLDQGRRRRRRPASAAPQRKAAQAKRRNDAENRPPASLPAEFVAVAEAALCLGGRRSGRVPDRDGLWPRRRRHQRRGGRAALRRQGPAVVQSADRACRRSRRGAGGWRCSTPPRKSSPRRSGPAR